MHAVRAPVAFDGGRFLEGGATVVVDGDRIVGVEAFGYDLPEGCTLASYDGTVLPGLINAHTHLAAEGTLGSLERVGAATDDEIDAWIEQSLLSQVRAGVTTVRDLGTGTTARSLPATGRLRDCRGSSPPAHRSRLPAVTATTWAARPQGSTGSERRWTSVASTTSTS
jgi:imidazolonepropionase-like amidohydrolase